MNRILISLTLFAAACGTTSDAAPAAKPAAAQAQAPSDHDACVAVFTRNRACTDDFIPALVDARARLDKPAGIRDAVAHDRGAVIAQAKAEWAEDSKDDKIAATCQHLVDQGFAPGDVDASRACVAKPACGEFVACIAPLFEKHLQN